MRNAIVATLRADAALDGYLPGGVHSARDADRISRQETPTAFDASGELLACAFVRLTTELPVAPYNNGALLAFSVYFYQRSGRADLETARRRTKALLHRQRITPLGGGGCWGVRHADDVLDTRDDELAANMAVSRYTATWRQP